MQTFGLNSVRRLKSVSGAKPHYRNNENLTVGNMALFEFRPTSGDGPAIFKRLELGAKCPTSEVLGSCSSSGSIFLAYGYITQAIHESKKQLNVTSQRLMGMRSIKWQNQITQIFHQLKNNLPVFGFGCRSCSKFLGYCPLVNGWVI